MIEENTSKTRESLDDEVGWLKEERSSGGVALTSDDMMAVLHKAHRKLVSKKTMQEDVCYEHKMD